MQINIGGLMSGGLMSGGRMSGGQMSGGRLSGGLMSAHQPAEVTTLVPAVYVGVSHVDGRLIIMYAWHACMHVLDRCM